jgi:hypothetical protein
MLNIFITLFLTVASSLAVAEIPATHAAKKDTIMSGMNRQVLDFNKTASSLAMLKIILYHPRIAITLGSNPQFRADVNRYWFIEQRGTEFILDKLAEDYPLFAQVKDQLFEAIHKHTLNREYAAFLEDLKTRGFNVIIHTSAGPKTVAHHAAKYPEFFANTTIVHGDNFDDYRGNKSFWDKILAKSKANGNTGKVIAIERNEKRKQQAEAAGIEVIVARNAKEARPAFEKRFGPLK